MAETLFEELKRYVGFSPEDAQALRDLHTVVRSHFARIAEVFYVRILEHEGARKALEGGESQVGHLKGTLQIWMDQLLRGPWVLGEQYSASDAYLYTIASWLEGDGVDLGKLPRVLEHRARMQALPAVARVLEAQAAAR